MLDNPFNEIASDIVVLIKPDGRRIEGVRSNVQSTKIFVVDGSLPIEEGDVVERKRPNGIVEHYTVLDAGYHDDFYGIPAHFEMEVRKESSIPRNPPSLSNNYYLTGPNSRVNNNSVDMSTNISHAQTAQLFADLRGALGEITDVGQREQLLTNVDEMEASQGSPGFLARYQAFIQNAANHMTVIGPFLPALSQLLS